MTVADTDVLIDFLAGQDPAADLVAREIARGRLATTSVTRFELLAGSRGQKSRQAVEGLLHALACLPLDAPAADRAAEVRRALEAKGERIGMADSLIAGIVLDRDAALMTRNRRHFERVPGIALVEL